MDYLNILMRSCACLKLTMLTYIWPYIDGQANNICTYVDAGAPRVCGKSEANKVSIYKKGMYNNFHKIFVQ